VSAVCLPLLMKAARLPAHALVRSLADLSQVKFDAIMLLVKGPILTSVSWLPRQA
jgi:hypothetical protein